MDVYYRFTQTYHLLGFTLNGNKSIFAQIVACLISLCYEH